MCLPPFAHDPFLGSALVTALTDLLCEPRLLPIVQPLIGESVDLLVGTKPPQESAASLSLVHQSQAPAAGSQAGGGIVCPGIHWNKFHYGWQPHLDVIWSGCVPPAIDETVSDHSDWD